MGKRKRSGAAYHTSSSDFMPCSSGRDLTPGQHNSSDPDNSSILFKPRPFGKEPMDSHGKQSNSQLSLGQHHHHNLSRSMFLKRSRHHYGNQYSRRNSSNHHRPSTSHGKSSSPFSDERLCFKFGSRYNSDLGHRPDFTDFRERAFWRPERIRSSSSFIHAVSPEGVRMVCVICQKSLRRKPHHFGTTTLDSEEPSIVAVLVCGHIFHADCLEQRTHLEDKRDPPCPICSGFVPKAEAT
ncbi:uncharacterized protein LOC104901922 isoform X3 [Beta vulgaris subsp. vulgaris]|uniref:uncharacterized protein LOC104901922 isoform X3 n=1 Tax=Beta vulgaris subsp. vulgaris TaxID=3555 RepID=UPI00053F418B|nr:uncharacterized protein LOC104901922 isoform X3 [Beta vulgaris subsp. vulgaris]